MPRVMIERKAGRVPAGFMTNHVHFLVTAEDPASISNTMKVVGSQFPLQQKRSPQEA